MLRVEQTPGSAPEAPWSVGGSLSLAAGTVIQDGTVRAPLGTITLGADTTPTTLVGLSGNELVYSHRVELGGGSITSVSAYGQTIPFGGTSDTVSYTYAGTTVAPFSPTLSLAGQSVAVAAGAVVDLRGGGVLAGGGGELLNSTGTALSSQGFISGRGGSTDTLVAPLLQVGGRATLETNPVYAIVAGPQPAAAPQTPLDTSSSYYGSLPKGGQTITLATAAGGLAAGTYTLLPSYYALLPGGYRVEINPAAKVPDTALSLPAGTTEIAATRGIAGTSVQSALPVAVLVTPGSAVRTLSQYNEEDYSTFLTAQAKLFDRVRPTLPQDAGSLVLTYPITRTRQLPLTFDGTALLAPAEDGRGSTLEVTGNGTVFQITAPGAANPTRAVGIAADALDAIGASRIVIGGAISYDTGIGGTKPSIQLTGQASSLRLNTGATLTAPEVILVANGVGQNSGAIILRPGATIDTAGAGAPPYDTASTGANYDTQRYSTVIVSNGQVTQAPVNTLLSQNGGPITIFNGARLLAGGSIILSTEQTTSIGGSAVLGARDLALSSPTINIGSQAALAATRLPSGLNLTQETLNLLIAGGAAVNVPALQSLELSASGSINLVGTVALGGMAGSLASVALATPALYGAGTPDDIATLRANTVSWSGIAQQVGTTSVYVSALPNGAARGGPGSGAGTLDIGAGRIILGSADGSADAHNITLDRTVSGFGTVNLAATDALVANNKSTLSVYQAQTGTGFAGSGGALVIATPLVTGASGAQLGITAGTAITLAGTGAPAGAAAGLGATLAFTAPRISDTARIAAPAGQVTLTATNGDLSLGAGGRIDVSGPAVTLGSQTRAVNAGNVILASTRGRVTLDAASVIDISSAATAGSLTVTAPFGTATVDGAIQGAGAGAGGSVIVRAFAVPDFTGLNARLNTGGVTGARVFDVGTGDLTLAGTIRANKVDITASGGSLFLSGTIDASGNGPGTVSLAARDGLSLTGSAVITAKANSLAVDGYGAPIASENRADVSLTARTGILSLAPGAVLDVSVPGGTNYGTVELYAPRTPNGIAIAAGGPLAIRGATSIALYGTAVQSPAGGVVTQAVLDAAGVQDAAFVMAARANGDLQSRIAGLLAYGDTFHLRPALELASSGVMTVQGDLNLAGLRTPGLGGGAAVEPGALTLRAGGTLNVFGSITDGFGAPPEVKGKINPDDNGWVLFSGAEPLGQDVTVPRAVTLGSGTTFATNTGRALNYDVTLGSFALRPDVVIPTAVTLLGGVRIPVGGFVTTADVSNAAGAVIYPKGTILPQHLLLPAGTRLAAGSVLPTAASIAAGSIWPAGSSFAPVSSFVVTAAGPIALQAGDVIPNGTGVRLPGSGAPLALRASVGGVQGSVLATAPLSPAGTLSWSIRLVGGADTASANLRATSAGAGDIVLADTHYAFPVRSTAQPGISVIRTGTGDLELLAGGSVTEASLFGVYTAGAQSAGIAPAFNLARGTDATGLVVPLPNTRGYDYNALNAAYQANYPTNGGNLLVSAQGDITGDVITQGVFGNSVQYQSDAVSNWLWRQGGPGLSTAWWINFGSYAAATNGTGKQELIGFTGFGTLGGGNATVIAGGNAGNTVSNLTNTARTTALDIAIGSTGRVASVQTASDGTVLGGTLLQTGGGDVTLQVGGTINGANTSLSNTSLGATKFGTIGTTRGTVTIDAGAIGRVSPTSVIQVTGPLVSKAVDTLGGPLLLLGDATSSLNARGDLVLGGVIDATRTGQSNSTPFADNAGGGLAAFTLWTGRSAVNLGAAGGTLVPTQDVTGPLIGTDLQYLYPGTLRAVAFGGDIVYGGRLGSDPSVSAPLHGPALELAPSATGTLELIAHGSVNATGLASKRTLGIDISGAPAGPNDLPNPFRPSAQQSVVAADGSSTVDSNATDKLDSSGYTSLFSFEADTPASTLHAADPTPARIIAANGDVVGLQFGEIWNFLSSDGKSTLTTWYLAAKPGSIEAGRDIIAAGNPNLLPSNTVIVPTQPLAVTGSLLLNNAATDVSSLSAKRDIFYSNVEVAGPGTLEVSAGRNLYQGGSIAPSVTPDKPLAPGGSLLSIGKIVDKVAGDRSGGAGIILLAGTGVSGPAEKAFAAKYLDPANLAITTATLASSSNAGRAVKTYADELLAYLKTTYGFTGSVADALTFFTALPGEKQLPFLLTVYFDELAASGKEYTDPASVRTKSYLRGRDAIATLFPGASYGGDITLYGGSGVATAGGGAITALAPGGQLVLGLANVPPPTPASGQPAAGLITFGNGDVDVYSSGSVVLGQSRIFTTYGGGITIWSATGDISAGRGAKTTQIFQPAETDYDKYGNITLAPTAPTSGAGIATLAPVAGVAPGDINLIAPLGTIDAGEAGIRSSGNVNLAAAVLANTANVQAGGKTSGVAVAASANTGALEAGSAASAATSNATTQAGANRSAASRSDPPSVIFVELVSFGEN